MAADPVLFPAGLWLGAASGGLALLTAAGFLWRWGIRFRLVGITSFTALLALSCLAFAISYRPRLQIEGAVTVPVVFDNGSNLVVAAAPAGLGEAAVAPSLEQLARNLRGSGRATADGRVAVRLRRVEAVGPGLDRPVLLGEVQLDARSGELVGQQPAAALGQAPARR